MDMLQQLGQGVKKVGTGLETFVTGAGELETLKAGITNAQTEQNIGKGPGNVPGAVMNRVGGALGGMLGLVPGANAPQGRGGGYYGLKSLGESFALPAQQFLGLQARRAPQMQTGAFGEIVQHDPVSGRSQVVQPGRSEMMATSLGIFEQTPEGEFKPRFLPPAEAPEMPSLDDMMGMRFAQMEPEDQRRALMGRFGVDPYRLPNMNFDQLATLAYRQGNQAGVEDALAMKQTFAGAEQEGLDPTSFKTYENLAVYGLMSGNKELADVGRAWALEKAKAGRATDTEQELPLSGRVADAYRRGESLSSKAAGLKAAMATTPSTLEEAIEIALLHRENPARESGGMEGGFVLLRLKDRNPAAYAMLEKAKLLDEYGELLPEIIFDNIPQYSGGKAPITPTPSPGATPSPTPMAEPLTDAEVAEEIQRRRKNMGF